jgi:hypothetical protein
MLRWLPQEGQIKAEDFDALCKSIRATSLPQITDDLSRWMTEAQWAALTPLQSLPVSFLSLKMCMEPHGSSFYLE